MIKYHKCLLKKNRLLYTQSSEQIGEATELSFHQLLRKKKSGVTYGQIQLS